MAQFFSLFGFTVSFLAMNGTFFLEKREREKLYFWSLLDQLWLPWPKKWMDNKKWLQKNWFSNQELSKTSLFVIPSLFFPLSDCEIRSNGITSCVQRERERKTVTSLIEKPEREREKTRLDNSRKTNPQSPFNFGVVFCPHPLSLSLSLSFVTCPREESDYLHAHTHALSNTREYFLLRSNPLFYRPTLICWTSTISFFSLTPRMKKSIPKRTNDWTDRALSIGARERLIERVSGKGFLHCHSQFWAVHIMVVQRVE